MSHRKGSVSELGPEFISIVPVNDPTIKAKRWQPRFSLRTFLVLTALLALASGWFSHRLLRAESQKKTLEWIRNINGSSAAYDFNLRVYTHRECGFIGYRRNFKPMPKWAPSIIVRWLGIDFFATVQSVFLYYPSDIEPLANLDQTVSLEIVSHGVDISPIARLKNLKFLALSRGDLPPDPDPTKQDLSPLVNLVELEYLDLTDTYTDDLSPLANMKQLRFLKLKGMGNAANLFPLRGLVLLKLLDLQGNPGLTDCSSLSSLPELEYLDLSESKITDLTPLQNLRKLKQLNLSECTMASDLTPLTHLLELEYLDLSNTSIDDLSPLVNMNKLLKLKLCHTGVTDLTPLRNLSNLRLLKLDGNAKISQAEIAQLLKALPDLKARR